MNQDNINDLRRQVIAATDRAERARAELDDVIANLDESLTLLDTLREPKQGLLPDWEPLLRPRPGMKLTDQQFHWVHGFERKHGMIIPNLTMPDRHTIRHHARPGANLQAGSRPDFQNTTVREDVTLGWFPLRRPVTKVTTSFDITLPSDLGNQMKAGWGLDSYGGRGRYPGGGEQNGKDWSIRPHHNGEVWGIYIYSPGTYGTSPRLPGERWGTQLRGGGQRRQVLFHGLSALPDTTYTYEIELTRTRTDAPYLVVSINGDTVWGSPIPELAAPATRSIISVAYGGWEAFEGPKVATTTDITDFRLTY